MVPRLRLKTEWLVMLGALALALGLAVFYYFWRPTVLTVAVAPRGGIEAKLIETFAAALRDQKMDVRLRLVDQDDVRDSAEALRRRQADLAVIRPDVLLPENGLTVAILREEAALIVAPAAAKVKEIGDLARRRLGTVSRHDADPAFIAALLQHYDLAPPAVTLVPLALEDVEGALREKRIDAVAMVAAPTSEAAAALVRAVEQASDRKIAIVPVPESEALAQRFPALTSVTVPAGTLTGRPKQPEDELKTVGVSYRLVARQDLDRTVVAEVAQYLFQMRSRLAQATGSANLIKAPDSDTLTSATLPNHPGAVDYLQREQLTFMDRYGDWIWIALFSMGGVSSAFAWVTQRFARQRRELVDQVLDRLLCMLTEARGAKTVVELNELAVELDGLVTHAVRYARNRTTGTRTMSALIVAIDSVRSAIADRRREVIDEAAGPAKATRRISAAS